MSLALHPCVSDPFPKSIVQPWLIAESKVLKILTRDIPPNHPYYNLSASQSGEKTLSIPYFELHGLGSPLTLDVGSGGDVYLDLTPGAHALWGKTSKGWQRWIDMGTAGDSRRKLLSNGWAVKHPLLEYSLWLGTNTQNQQYVGWLRSIGDWRPAEPLRRTRDWASQLGLFKMPRIGITKGIAEAEREAAAMLEKSGLAPVQRFKALQPISSAAAPLGAVAEIQPKPQAPQPIPPSRVPPLTNGDVTRPQHPCFMNPNPVSLIQPQITVKQRGFIVHSLPSSYPYHAELDLGSCRIPFLEFSGCGPPTEDLDVGTAGDVYFDLTPGAYSLYAKIASGWKRWSDTGETLGTVWPNADWIIKHPHFESYALWFSVGTEHDAHRIHRVGWYGAGTANAQRRAAQKLELIRMQKVKVKKGGPKKSEETMNREAHNILQYMLNSQGLREVLPYSPSNLSAKRAGGPLVSDSRKKVKSEEPEAALGDFGLFSMHFELRRLAFKSCS
ncbi:hypothetical protein K438DRAFT_243438 [Mycena galopus ATCC 62051]|nr:hypothetical protein K438DRAFT_243438 [Mycena galopus ATCC 62051]